MFAITACLAYLRYGQQTEPNLIRMLPASWPVYLDTCLVTAQIWLSMVVGVSPLFQHLEDKLAIARGVFILVLEKYLLNVPGWHARAKN